MIENKAIIYFTKKNPVSIITHGIFIFAVALLKTQYLRN
jgi:hypothetical protein